MPHQLQRLMDRADAVMHFVLENTRCGRTTSRDSINKHLQLKKDDLKGYTATSDVILNLLENGYLYRYVNLQNGSTDVLFWVTEKVDATACAKVSTKRDERTSINRSQYNDLWHSYWVALARREVAPIVDSASESTKPSWWPWAPKQADTKEEKEKQKELAVDEYEAGTPAAFPFAPKMPETLRKELEALPRGHLPADKLPEPTIGSVVEGGCLTAPKAPSTNSKVNPIKPRPDLRDPLPEIEMPNRPCEVEAMLTQKFTFYKGVAAREDAVLAYIARRPNWYATEIIHELSKLLKSYMVHRVIDALEKQRRISAVIVEGKTRFVVSQVAPIPVNVRSFRTNNPTTNVNESQLLVNLYDRLDDADKNLVMGVLRRLQPA